MDQSDITKESETAHHRRHSEIATRRNHPSERHASKMTKKAAHRAKDHDVRKKGVSAVKKIRRTAIGLLIAFSALGITSGARAAQISINEIEVPSLSRGIEPIDIQPIRTRLIEKAIDTNRIASNRIFGVNTRWIEANRIIAIDCNCISEISV